MQAPEPTPTNPGRYWELAPTEAELKQSAFQYSQYDHSDEHDVKHNPTLTNGSCMSDKDVISTILRSYNEYQRPSELGKKNVKHTKRPGGYESLMH